MHSPEPWKHDREEGELYDANGAALCDTDGMADDNFVRVVASVNFCQHIPTELLERLVEARVGAKQFIEWTKENPTRASSNKWGELEYFECIECDKEGYTTSGEHTDDCLLNAALDLIGEKI